MSPDRLLAADAVTVAVTHAAGLAEGHAAEGEIMLVGITWIELPQRVIHITRQFVKRMNLSLVMLKMFLTMTVDREQSMLI